MNSLAVGLILASALMHALWNVFVKIGDDRLATMALVMGCMALGGAVLILISPTPAAEAWPYLLTSALLNNIYFVLLIECYRRGDLSHAYPIIRGTAPLAVAGGAVWFVGEAIGAFELVGVVMISVSIASLVWAGRRGTSTGRGNVMLPIVTGLLVASFTVSDGLGVRLSESALGYIGWLFVLAALPILAYAYAVRRAALTDYLVLHRKQIGMAGVFSFGSYACAVLALNLGAMAPIAALRETSVIFAAVLGATMLGEPFGTRRIIAAVGVATGAILIQVGG